MSGNVAEPSAAPDPETPLPAGIPHRSRHGPVPPVPSHAPRPTSQHLEDLPPCPENRTLFQAFEWYCPADHQHWNRLAKEIPSLAALGVSTICIPPACKGGWNKSNGYDIYDLYDLGEFDQHGGKPTKWGSKDELVALIKVANEHGVGVLFDAVLNHKAASDYTENIVARKVDPKDRTNVTGNLETIETWTGFDFKGRHGTYSPFKWNHSHFNGTDYDNKTKEKAIWKIEGKEWAKDVDDERGNFDYLMFANIDHSHAEVKYDLFYWIQWLASQLPLAGLRLDAAKHYSRKFQRSLVEHIDKTVDNKWMVIAEYLHHDTGALVKYLEAMHHRVLLYDIPLVTNFGRISLAEHGDLRTILKGTLTSVAPLNSVNVVANHDTQLGQAYEIPIADFFVPMAYSIILLNIHSHNPCVFYGHIYGTLGPDKKPKTGPSWMPPACGGMKIPRMMLVRRLYAYGEQTHYLDDPYCVGFTRYGHPSKSGGAGLAVVMTNSWEWAIKRMYVGKQHAGEVWTDSVRSTYGEVTIRPDGWANFPVAQRSVSVWVDKRAVGRELVDNLIFDDDIYGLRHVQDSVEKTTTTATDPPMPVGH